MPKQGHQGLASAKVMTFSEMANQFKTIIWRTTPKDENTTQKDENTIQKDKEEFLKGDEEFLKARQTILYFYQAWAKIFHAMSGTSTDDETERIFHAASGKNAVSMRTMN